ncbi:hypothetical protein LWM38_18405 [Vibrio kanaloae]|uniref:hypothetical protein n=1 Tax=Vibrio kanaloae TaxID=170673 RepID=UPI001F1E3BB8|nr:hypothetical protein [Vibrio kanaloae]UIJ42369.1 hypothetical protein LWM38_18405 [Vibrio kanaloae]
MGLLKQFFKSIHKKKLASPPTNSNKSKYSKQAIRQRMSAEEYRANTVEKIRYCNRHVIESLVLQKDNQPLGKLARGSVFFTAERSVLMLKKYNEAIVREMIVELFDYQRKSYEFDDLSSGCIPFYNNVLIWSIRYYNKNKEISASELPFFMFRNVTFRVDVIVDKKGG